MKKFTEWSLKASITIVGICTPIIVVVSIYETGNYWNMLYLVLGAAIVLLMVVLLGHR